MKAIQCELCGSNHLIKTDGYFVCQHCETKYTLEEARKLIIEGKVDVSGSTVKIDNSSKIDNLFKLARRARSENNYNMATRYYESILIELPDNWEAVFYSALLQAIRSDANGLLDAYNLMQENIKTVLKILVDYYLSSPQLTTILSTIISEIHTLVLSWFNTGQFNYIGNKTENLNWSPIGTKIIRMEFDLGESIESSFEGKNNVLPCVALAWKNGIQTNTDVRKKSRFPNKAFCKQAIKYYYPKIYAIDNSYQLPKK